LLVGVELIRVGMQRAVVDLVVMAVVVEIVVAGVAKAVHVLIGLVRIRDIGAVVADPYLIIIRVTLWAIIDVGAAITGVTDTISQSAGI
jgi:hypothetical protein